MSTEISGATEGRQKACFLLLKHWIKDTRCNAAVWTWPNSKRWEKQFKKSLCSWHFFTDDIFTQDKQKVFPYHHHEEGKKNPLTADHFSAGERQNRPSFRRKIHRLPSKGNPSGWIRVSFKRQRAFHMNPLLFFKMSESIRIAQRLSLSICSLGSLRERKGIEGLLFKPTDGGRDG